MELAELVQEVIGRDMGVRHGLPKKQDIRKNYSAIVEVCELRGWRPQIFWLGVAQMPNHYLKVD